MINKEWHIFRYVEEEVQLERTDPGYAEFSRIFKAFKVTTCINCNAL